MNLWMNEWEKYSKTAMITRLKPDIALPKCTLPFTVGEMHLQSWNNIHSLKYHSDHLLICSKSFLCVPLIIITLFLNQVINFFVVGWDHSRRQYAPKLIMGAILLKLGLLKNLGLESMHRVRPFSAKSRNNDRLEWFVIEVVLFFKECNSATSPGLLCFIYSKVNPFIEDKNTPNQTWIKKKKI